MRNKVFFAVAIIAVMGMTSGAQDRFEFRRGEAVEFPPQGAIDIVGVDPVLMGTTVLDAPYSAEAVTEVTQVLSDGNRIEQKTSAVVARNSQGRTRREQQGLALGTLVAQGGPTIVTIADPSSGVLLRLNYDQKVAYRMKPGVVRFSEQGASAAAGGVRAGSGRVLSERSAAIATGPAPPFDPAGLPGRPAPPIATLEMAGPLDAPMVFSGAIASAGVPWGGEVRSETLEPQAIEGVQAVGTRTTMTIPAGTMGNALPIEVVNERWFSPELKVVLLTRRYDPRFGETVYRLTNIVRNEPSPDLFTVPSDFRIEDIRR